MPASSSWGASVSTRAQAPRGPTPLIYAARLTLPAPRPRPGGRMRPVFARHPGDAAMPFRLAPFTAAATAPIGHPLMGGGIAPAARVDDPLYAHGLILAGA